MGIKLLGGCPKCGNKLKGNGEKHCPERATFCGWIRCTSCRATLQVFTKDKRKK